MSTSNMKSKGVVIKTYTCEAVTCDFPTKFQKYAEFPAGLDDDCTLSIWLKHTSKSSMSIGTAVRTYRDVDVIVKKSNTTPIRARLTLNMMQTCSNPEQKSKKLDFWTNTCHFMNFCFSSLSDEPTYKINLTIAWYIPDPDELGMCANPYIRIPDFLLTDRLTDVKIIIGQEIIEAHRLILGAASPVLLAMLTSPAKEGLEKCIVVKDIAADIMRIILKIVYTAQDDDLDNVDVAQKVLAVAAKYEMKALKNKCARKLLEQLSVANALEFLDLADTYGAELLKSRCMKFLVKHQGEIVKTEYFTKIFLKKPALMMQFTVGVINSRAVGSYIG